MTNESVEVFDTTLRDGLQVEGVSATVDDKLRIAEQLDYLGVHFIEGGWPGANPKDIEFFARAATELQLTSSTMVAFGSTRRPKGKVDDDATLRNLLDANTSTVCIVAKSWDYHVLNALQTTLDEGEAMIADSVEFLAGNGRQVMVDMSSDEVSQGLPGGSMIFQGTNPTCTSADNIVFQCTLASAPTEEVEDDYTNSAQLFVDSDLNIAGGCRGQSADGLHWTCYLGQRAVDEQILAADLLGQHEPAPGRG